MVNTTAEVAVIGAGVVGCSTALELARTRDSVVVLDRAPGPGQGSTSASSAIVRFNYSTRDATAMAWEAKFRWEKWADHLGFRDPAGMARFVRTGMVFFDVDLMPRERMCALFDSVGVPYETWETRELERRLPGIDPGRYFPPKPVTADEFFADATSRLGAVYLPDAGYVDDPSLAAANLARAAQRHGARLLFRSRVTGLARGGDGVWRIELAGGDRVEAPVVVNAGGPWSTALNTLAGVGSDFTVTVAPMRQEVHHTPMPGSLSNLGRPAPILADLDLGVYVRPDGQQGLLIGGMEPECDPLEWLDDPDAASPFPTAARFEAQVLRAARRLPDLEIPNRPRGIAGVYDVASDWTPIFDRTDRPGFFVAMGTSGNQFKNAPIIGEVMLALVTAARRGQDHDAEPVRLRGGYSGNEINLGSFSRRRAPNADSSGTVMG